MKYLKFLNKFYLDKEKDIIINLYKSSEDEITYILETPNHNTGNLITNLAKICNVETIKNENDMKIITGTIPASINGDNEIVYIFRLGGFKIANIYENGKIEIKAKIPAITKTLMSQTKEYNLPIEKTIIKSYILKKSKFRTDLHLSLIHIFKNIFTISCFFKISLAYCFPSFVNKISPYASYSIKFISFNIFIALLTLGFVIFNFFAISVTLIFLLLFSNMYIVFKYSSWEFVSFIFLPSILVFEFL